MIFMIEDTKTLDPATLSDELIAALGSNYGISTAGNIITTNSPEEPDPAAFQSVLDAHVLKDHAGLKKAKDVRSIRDKLLLECDWTVLADAPLTSAQKTAWKAYRQELRNITEQPTFPTEIIWPTKLV